MPLSLPKWKEDILPVVSVNIFGVGENAGTGWVGVAVDAEVGVAMICIAIGATVGVAGFFAGAQEITLLPRTIISMIPTMFQPGRKAA
ncbi:MAG: hypothetical protein WA821_17235 [Anaerolineales bacterium]